ncbi:MAG: adenylate/guanylate cyclase domain-containing protein [Chitinophagales bacterium]|nr:adenylate/guanylate cyclase domain-containing protein [Chitinophagales bacterium]
MVARIVGLEEFDSIEVIEKIRYQVAFTQATIAGIVIGIILGLIDSYLIHKSKRKRSFSFLVLTKGIIYITAIIAVLTSILVITDLVIDQSGFNKTANHLTEFFQEGFFFSMLIYALVISFLVSFIKQVNIKFGPGVLIPFIFGKYYKPRQEDRIFMFIDLHSSTTYAEKIGHIKFSELIQDCFYDLGSMVEKYRADIYQYVGDEAVLTWRIRKGIQNQNCIKIFFAFDDYLQSRSIYYAGKYGFIPQFKAGINCGLVMVAEVGDIKKEIAYHGDVLNTGARIQGECNKYKKKLLISEAIKNILPSSREFMINKIGEVDLKGKVEATVIYSVEKN